MAIATSAVAPTTKMTIKNSDVEIPLSSRFYPILRAPKIIRFSLILLFNSLGLYSLYLAFSGNVYWQTLLFSLLWIHIAIVGVTAGAHRYWCHRAYKAQTPLRILLMIFHTVSMQFTIFDWVLVHRIHHKYVDTDKDPHNAESGFLFSHMTWVYYFDPVKFQEIAKTIDYSDMENDDVVQFQRRNWWWLQPLFVFLIPSLTPWLLWNESLWGSFMVGAICSKFCSTHGIFTVNSLAHMWGSKPYDRSQRSTESRLVAILALGEGWHNYHHVFPWDYKARELPHYSFNLTTAFIDLCAYFGQAYDLRTPSKSLIDARARRSGDGSRESQLYDLKTIELDDHDDALQNNSDPNCLEKDELIFNTHEE